MWSKYHDLLQVCAWTVCVGQFHVTFRSGHCTQQTQAGTVLKFRQKQVSTRQKLVHAFVFRMANWLAIPQTNLVSANTANLKSQWNLQAVIEETNLLLLLCEPDSHCIQAQTSLAIFSIRQHEQQKTETAGKLNSRYPCMVLAIGTKQYNRMLEQKALKT